MPRLVAVVCLYVYKFTQSGGSKATLPDWLMPLGTPKAYLSMETPLPSA